MKATKENFLKYVEIQHIGNYNMFTEANTVMEIMGVDKDTYIDVLQNYSKYMEMYKEEAEEIIKKVNDEFIKNLKN